MLAKMGKSKHKKSLISNCSKGLVIIKNGWLYLKLIVLYLFFL